MVEADGRNAATVERLFSRPPPVAGGPARRGRSSVSRRKATALRPSGWWRRSGLAARCCVHKERWATPSRRSAGYCDHLPVAGGPARRGGRALGAADGERCGRRAGGGASCCQRDAVHIESDGRRRDGGVLAVAPQRRMSMRGLWRAWRGGRRRRRCGDRARRRCRRLERAVLRRG